MTVNVVNVTIQADGAPGDLLPPEGNYVFTPSGVEWPDSGANPIVPEVIHGSLVGNTGVNPPIAIATVELVASDNFSAGTLLWDVIINLRGLPTVNVADVAVNFSQGATQNVWTILQAAGWTPVEQP